MQCSILIGGLVFGLGGGEVFFGGLFIYLYYMLTLYGFMVCVRLCVGI